MSLVSEALKKAQREAAQREGRARHLPEPLLGAAAQPFVARRRGRRMRRLAALAVVAAAALGLAVWRLRPAPPPLTAPPAGRVSAPPGTVPAPISAEKASSPVRAEPLAAPDPGPQTPAGEPAATVTSASEPAASASEPAAPAVSVPGPEPGSRAGAAAVTAPEADGAFLRRAVLPDGTQIELGGIAWSPETPVAMLNGRLLGLHEGVAGCLVEAIERDQVRLRCVGGETLTVRLMERRRRPAPARGAD